MLSLKTNGGASYTSNFYGEALTTTKLPAKFLAGFRMISKARFLMSQWEQPYSLSTNTNG